MKNLTKIVVTTAAMAMTVNAMAAGTTSSTSVKTSTASKILSKMSATYSMDYTGSQLSDPTSVQTSDDKGVATTATGEAARTNILHTPKLNYKINDKLTAWAQARYVTYTGGLEGGDNLTEPNDPRVGVNIANAYKLGSVAMGLTVYTEEALTSASIEEGRARRVGIATSGSYNLNSKTSAGLYTLVRPRFYRNDELQDANPEYDFYISPSISYSANDKVSLNAYYEVYALQNGSETEDLTNIRALESVKSLVLGVGLNVAKNLTITPELDLFEADAYQLETARIGATASYTIF